MVYYQSWDDVLFLHWKTRPDDIAPRLPRGLEASTFGGAAWVSAVLFRLTVRLRGLPRVPRLSRLVELNVRTYARCGGREGVWLLRVQADNHAACRLARLLTPLPYEYRPLRYRRTDAGFGVSDAARRNDLLAFSPSGLPAVTLEGSVDEWLVERYLLFARGTRTSLTTAEVTHPRWAVRTPVLTGWDPEFGRQVGVGDRQPDAAHFSDGVHAVFGPFRPVPSCSIPRKNPHSRPAG